MVSLAANVARVEHGVLSKLPLEGNSSKPRIQGPGSLREDTHDQPSPTPTATPRPSHPSAPRSFHSRGRPRGLDIHTGAGAGR